jgi:hypothetical protein
MVTIMDKDCALCEVKTKMLYYNLYEGKSSQEVVSCSLCTLRYQRLEVMLLIYSISQTGQGICSTHTKHTTAVFDSALSIRYCEVDELTGRTPRAALLGLCLP